jgi:hypothetical protein
MCHQVLLKTKGASLQPFIQRRQAQANSLQVRHLHTAEDAQLNFALPTIPLA